MKLDVQKAVDAYLGGRLSEHVVVNRHPSKPLVILRYRKDLGGQAYVRMFDDPVVRMCRGLILHTKTVEVVGLPLFKFFGIGEVEETQPANLPREPFVAYEKVDGSLLYSYRDSTGTLCLASPGSFDSPEARTGMRLMKRLGSAVSDVSDELTLAFELVSPDHAEVIDYGGTEELVLLAAKNRRTGVELDWDTVKLIAARLGVRVPRVYEFGSLEELITARATFPSDLEGVVVRFASGMRVKLKGDSYLDQLKLKKAINHGDIKQAVREGRLETYLAGKPEELWPHITDIADEYKAAVEGFEAEARKFFAQASEVNDPKAFAAWVNGDVPKKFLGAMFLLRNSKTPDWFKLAKK